MRSIIVVFAALAIMVIGLIGSAVILLDDERLKSLVTRHVEHHTGRKVEIRGDIRVRLFPGLRLSAEQIVMAGPEGYDGPDPVTIDRLDMQVRLLPLIRGKIDASNVRLRGARLNFHAGEDGSSTLGRLMARLGGEDHNGDLWASGPVTFDDLRITMSSKTGQEAESLDIESMELDGFALGRPLEFRFRGNIGEPAVFDWLEVDGLIVRSESRFRLSNMRMEGTAGDGRYVVQLLGNLSFSPDAPLNLALDGGQLRVNDHEMKLDLTYRGFDRPYFSAAINAPFVDVDVMMLTAMAATVPHWDPNGPVLSALRGLDFDLDVKVDRVAQLGMVLDGFELSARGRDGRVVADSMQANVPGAMVLAQGNLDLTSSRSVMEFSFRAEVGHLSSLLSAMRLPWDIDGAGLIGLDLSSARSSVAQGQSPWVGSGHLELWDGQWPLLGRMMSSPGSGTSDSFEFLGATLVLDTGQLALEGLQLASAEVAAEGQLSIRLPDQEIDGELHIYGPTWAEVIGLAGTPNHPQLSRVPLVIQPDS